MLNVNRVLKLAKILAASIIGMLLLGCGGDSGKSESKANAKSAVESSSENSVLVVLLREYNDILEEYAVIMKKVDEGDLTAMSGTLAFMEKVAKWTEKWEKEMERSRDDLSPSDLSEILKEYQRLLERYHEMSKGM